MPCYWGSIIRGPASRRAGSLTKWWYVTIILTVGRLLFDDSDGGGFISYMVIYVVETTGYITITIMVPIGFI